MMHGHTYIKHSSW